VGQRVGLIQLFNIFGNTAGAVITGLVLLHWLGTINTLRLIGLTGCCSPMLSWARERRKTRFHSSGLGDASPRPGGACRNAFAAVVSMPTNAKFWSGLHGTSLKEGASVAEDRTGIAVLRPSFDATRLLYISGHAQAACPSVTCTARSALWARSCIPIQPRSW
jgi:hypothetical protein